MRELMPAFFKPRRQIIPSYSNMLMMLIFFGQVIAVSAEIYTRCFSDQHGGRYMLFSHVRNFTETTAAFLSVGACNTTALIEPCIGNARLIERFCLTDSANTSTARVSFFAMNDTTPDQLYLNCVRNLTNFICKMYDLAPAMERAIPLMMAYLVLSISTVFITMCAANWFVRRQLPTTAPIDPREALAAEFNRRYDDLENEITALIDTAPAELAITCRALKEKLEAFFKKHQDPISLGLLYEPVTLSSGITYSSHTIEPWIRRHGQCPKTQQLVSRQLPSVNFERKNEIARKLEKYTKALQDLKARLPSASAEPTSLLQKKMT